MSLDMTKLHPDQELLIKRGYCGRPTRNPAAKGPYCTQNAGTRTDHPGEGACWLHGGNNVITTGRYSSVKRRSIRQLIEEFEEDPEPLNTMPEIALARSHLVDFINRYHTWRKAFFDWHASYQAGVPHDRMFDALEHLLNEMEVDIGEDVLKKNKNYQTCLKAVMAYKNSNPKPMQILDIADAVKLASEVTKMVERVGKLMAANAVSRRDFARIMGEIGNIIDQVVTDDRMKMKIRDKMANLRLA